MLALLAAAAVAEDFGVRGGLVIQVDRGPEPAGFLMPMEEHVHGFLGGFLRGEAEEVGAQLELGFAPIRAARDLADTEWIDHHCELHLQVDVEVIGPLCVGGRMGAGVYVGNDFVRLGEGAEIGWGLRADGQTGLVLGWAPERRWSLQVVLLEPADRSLRRAGIGGTWALRG